jgi:ACT domain-containing protein
MQVENQAYKQEAPCSTSRSNADIVIIGRSSASMEEAFQLLEEACKEVRLVVHKCKTKYMVAANT